ncbi:uncharacterized protein ACMZJ9_009929 [Mantella aurantiaca]
MIDIILHKGESASEKLLHHFNNMIVRFPALFGLSQFLHEEKKKHFQELVQQLEMNPSSKVTLRDILSIGPENLKEAELHNVEEIPWHFLRNLMALNRTSRNTQLKKDPTAQESNDDDMFDIFQAKCDISNTIHPLDVLCVLLHCTDSFLQQEIVTKMSMCQFSVPLLLPSTGDGSPCTFLLWAMRGIVKKWRPHSLTDSKGFKEKNVANTPMPIFSFVRLGEDKLSKSKILNQILNPAQQHHNFFIYHDMEGGNIKRKISDGLVEISWYFPCGSSDVFPEPIAVTNLRGALEANWDQFTFLTRISSAVFIFVDNISESQFRLLSTCSNADTQYYFIVTPGQGKDVKPETQTFLKHIMETLKINKKQIIIKGNNSNEAEFVKKIQNILESLLSTELQQLSLETAKKQTYGLQIDVDENNPECQKARACACNITSVIKDVEGYKKEMLKLQGDLWKQLAKVEKELCRMTKQGEMGTEEYQSQLKQQRIALHREQHQHNLTDAMALFINAITHLCQVEKQYFLIWMKLELDLIARRNLSALQVEYREKCKSRSDNPEELKQVDQKISDSSLGIEHFLRELGQFYEAECSMVKERNILAERAQFTGLPGIAADLLLDGFPLELIDGDASNIPLKWITDVLTELDTKTGGVCRLRVITVLGVQSTGKSTLLNTMFGLQFPVASGRCTRGAFMTLINVKENFQEELGCHFILVIDTEGLKAPELASLEGSYAHDNELATLVVGLSDITIVNMAMENTTEMRDILQIVVHAFLRMKDVGKKPNCQFVHQNVSDVSAYEKNMRDRKKLLEQLDEMTKVAAKMEKKNEIKSFNDVLDYDLDKHSWYIPGLWQGVPPMAPVNSGYSENVNNLKQHLFEFMKSQNASCNIGDFIKWIESLWRAVKHEKFIFSFRNSLVADAYNKLSIQFSLWEWEFSKKVYNFLISTENNIKNQSFESLDTEACEEYRRELQHLLFEEENKMLALLEKYYDNNSENVHLVERYREDFKLSIHFLRKELERNALNKCTKAISIQKGKFKIQNIQTQYQKLMEEKISDLLENCREVNVKLNDEEIQQGFESMWEKTLTDLQIKKLDRLKVGQSILQHLRNDLRNKGPAVHEELKKVKNLENHGLRTFKMTKMYIDLSLWKQFIQKFGFEKQTSEMIEALAVSLIEMCDKYIKEKVNTAEDYDDTYCQELLHMINTELGNNTGPPFTVQFELDLKRIIFGNAAQAFQQMHDNFLKNNDPSACLECLKPQYLSIFISIFQEKDESQNRAKQFCERCLKSAITDYVFKHLGEKIVDDILNSSESITFSSRSFFQYNMLEELLEEMSFRKYVEYISSYKTFSETWILDYISEKYDGSETLENLYKKILSSIKTEIQSVLEDKECLQSPDASSFLEKVCEMLQKELVIPQNEKKVITFHNTAKVEQFSSDIQHFLIEIEQQILTELRSLDVDAVLSRVTLKPHCELFRKVVGCGKQCPFCGVPCEAGGGDHKEHFSSIHRSTGLGKWIWMNDDTLVIDICSSLVVSSASFRNVHTGYAFHPYKEYRTYYPDWAIQPDPSIESSDYWKYIFAHFNKKFAKKYNAEPAELPGDWKKIPKAQALDSLKKVFNNMSSPEEVSRDVRRLREKLVEIFEEDVEGLCDELDSLHLLSLEEYIDLRYDEDPNVKTQKMIDIILHKGESASEKLLHHFNNMILRFPALSGLAKHFPEDKNNHFLDLVEQLDMKNHLSSKVTLSDILSIGSESLTEGHPINIKDIPWHFLRNLMALKRISRCTKLKEKSATLADIDVFDMLKAEDEISSTIHPLDVLCVLLHCSDSFLQQEIVTKMAMCQFAIPLLLPAGEGSHCILMLWAMRNIVKKWRPQSLADSKGFREENIVDIPMPIFSFVRLGENKLSKSKTLNQILNPAQQQHNFFMHHDMDGGNIKRKISDGLVEMSWFFPCGNSDVFPEPIAVTNLRGGLEVNWNQFTFLTKVSTAVFIFIESISESQFELLSTCKNTETQYYFIIIPESGKDISPKMKTFLRHLMETLKVGTHQIICKRKNSNDADFVKIIQDILGSFFKVDFQKLALESMKSQTHGLQIDTDENFPECQKARAYACNITSGIRDVEEYKGEMLKLQGDLWKQLSKVEKEICRMTNQGEMGTEEYRSHLKQQRIALHREQNQQYLTDAMELFINAITHLSQVEKQYFLKWMKTELDLIARRNLSSLKVEYKERSRSDNLEELKQVDQKILNSSLGIEHFIRELGQFYEAECSMVKEKVISADRVQFTGLPGIAADLLLDGFPLELIDGDASNIPLKWITNVLTELDIKTGGKCKMKVITVLGVQSTGKSTLLNTMFGLQFPVASGRCTRGALMTLINVKENFQEELGCHFILVIDTEGLKAPELASLEGCYEHDNELATLVVGLSDITIVNMAMENTTEMKDILQIVVHAFLRMKEVGKKPNCQFVHQNVSDVSAHENNMRDRKKLLEQLDEMTKAAAKMEKKGGITSFNDVLDYDLDKHSWYIPGLWQGVPPMAPVNSGYSENVNNLKQHLFETMKTQNVACNIGDFITWIESLWGAVKHEKFIFSFRNSLVAEAYNKLSIQSSQWEWEFSKKVYNFVIGTENIIKNQSAESIDLETHEEEYRRELECLVCEEENKILDLLEKYYDSKSGNVHLIERYREDFRMGINILKKDLERNALNKYSETVSIQTGKFEIQNIQTQYQKLIEEKISDLLNNSRQKNSTLKDEEIQQEFESMWKKTLTDLPIKKLARRKVDKTILQQLRQDLHCRGFAANEKLKKTKDLASHEQHTFKMDEKYVRSWWNRLKNKLGLEREICEKIEKFAVSLINKCEMYVKEKADTSEDYDKTHSQELLYIINNQLKGSSLPFSREFESDIKFMILGNAAQTFQKMNDTFIRNNDPTTSLESLKPHYLSIFLSIFEEKDESRNRARQFCERCLKPAITNYVFKHLGEKMVDDILNSSESIVFCSRSIFQYNMLENLLEEMSFEKYVKYICSYEKFSESCILSFIQEKYESSTTLENVWKNVLSTIMMEVQTVLEAKACLKSPDVASFLEKVCEMLQKELVISQKEKKVITFHNTAKVEQFSSDIQRFLLEIEQQIITELRSLDVDAVLSRVTLKPHCELFRKVVGCGKQCPFCDVPCEAGGHDHKKHFSSVHRSTGLGGWRRVKDSILVADICSTLVVSDRSFRCSHTGGEFHPYKEYRTYFPDWAIQPDPSIESSDYWKYIFVQFNKKLAKEYRAKPARLPEDWKEITKTQALKSLKKVFNVI